MGGQQSHTSVISPLPREKTVVITGGNTGILLDILIIDGTDEYIPVLKIFGINVIQALPEG